MVALYVANATKQVHDFTYRVKDPGESGPTRIRMQKIGIGEQVRIHSPDMPIEMVQSIVEQHGKYGMTDASQIDQTRPFIGLIYSVGKPVDPKKFLYVSEHNNQVLIQRGHEIRKSAAVALHDQLQESGAGGVRSLQLSVQEEIDRDESGDTVDETIEVLRPGAGGSPSSPRKPSRRQRAA